MSTQASPKTGCDCIIRKDKEETKRNASRFTLVLFEEKTFSQNDIEQPEEAASKTAKGSWISRIRKLRDGGIILSKEMCEDRIHFTYIDVGSPKTAIQILPFILDLASLSKDGKAILTDTESLEQAVNQNKTDNWQEYYPALKKEVEQHKVQIQLLFEKLDKKADDVVRSMYVIPFSQTDNQFCIQRIGHLEDNMAELISYNYITHTYRAGKNSLLSLNFNTNYGDGDE